MKKIVFLLISVLTINVFSQNTFTIHGNFKDAKEKEIRLVGFNGTKDTLFSQTTSDAIGNFKLSYPKTYKGAALLQVREVTSLLLLLHQENINLTWDDLNDFNSVQFSNSKENEWFQQAFTINSDVQKKLAGLQYLLPLYKKELHKKEWIQGLEKEMQAQNLLYEHFYKKLPTTSYVVPYAKYRTILQQLQKENKTSEEIAEVEQNRINLDFGSIDLYHSGLAKELLDAYLKQIFKINTKETALQKSNLFSDQIKKSAQTNNEILNSYSTYLIKEYEKNGVVEAAAYLALNLLDDNKCIIDAKNLPLLEQYKKMAVGNTAANLIFHENSQYETLIDIESKYKIVIFGASWCEACKTELVQFADYAAIFKERYDAEIIFISMDTDKEAYTNYIKDFNFITDCDFKGWDAENVKNYYVFASPSFYILDKEHQIVAKPTNAIAVAKWLSDHKNK